MKIIFTLHSKTMMTKRNITEEMITETLGDPHIVDLTTADKTTKRVRRRYGGKELDVIYRPETGESAKVISTFWHGEGETFTEARDENII